MKIFSLSWIVSMFINTFVTILFIYILKMVFAKIDVPVVSNIVAEA